MGVLFGGVTDEDTSEETLESVFHNDLYVPFLLGLVSALNYVYFVHGSQDMGTS